MANTRGTMRRPQTQGGRMVPVLLCALALALCGCFSPRGQATSSEDSSVIEERIAKLDAEAIRKGIDQDLGPLVGPSADDLHKYFESVGVSPDESSMFTFDQQCELLSHLLRGFSYTVESVDVKGDEAQVTVQVVSLDTSGVVEKSAQAMSEGDEIESNAQLYNSTEESDHEALVQHVYDIVCAELDATTQTKTSEVTLRFTKDDEGWTLHQSSLVELLATLWS